jgi:Ca2+-binding RTX toxin-like protein
MRAIFSRQDGASATAQRARETGINGRRLGTGVERLESRNLLSGGTVVLTPGLVTITPSSSGPNTAIVSYQKVSGVTMLDVNLNGVNRYFSLAQVGFVYYRGANAAGAQTFENETSLHSVAWGGSGANLFISTTASDEFFGGSGPNTFDAGSGVDMLIGGSGANVFNENATGSGAIVEVGPSNTVNVPPGATGSYDII